MALASSNRAQLRYILESTFGTTPVVGNPTELRMTGESLKYNIGTDTSKEIRSDRQVSDLTQISATANGGVNIELSYKEYDDLLEAVFMGTWVEYGTNGTSGALTLTIDSTAGTIDGNAIAGADDFGALAVGQWFRLVAPSDAADGAILKVAVRDGTTDTITVDASTPIPGTGSRVGVTNCTITTSRLTNGVTDRSFTLEREFGDITQFFAFRGMKASKLSLSFDSGAITTGSLDFMGKDSVRSATTTLPGTPIASQTYEIMNAVAGVGNILLDGTALTGTFIKSLKLDIDNKLREQSAIGHLGSVGIAPGTLSVTGTMNVYLADGTIYDYFIDNTNLSLEWSTTDDAGFGYVFTVPNVEFNDATVAAGGLDQDVMLDISFTGLMDATLLKTIILDRL